MSEDFVKLVKHRKGITAAIADIRGQLLTRFVLSLPMAQMDLATCGAYIVPVRRMYPVLMWVYAQPFLYL